MTTPVRLLLATDAVGGVWFYSLELARALAPLGVEAVLAVMGPSPSPKQRAAAKGIRLIDTGLALDWLAKGIAPLRQAGRRLAALARAEGADLIQTPSGALLAYGAFDTPVIAVQHSCLASWWRTVRGSALPDDFRWRADLTRAGLQAADAVVAPSAAFATVTADLYGLEQVRAIHNGRSLHVLPAAPDDCVFTAGRLWDEGKDLATLDRAAAQLTVPVHAAGPVEGPNGAAIGFRAIHALGELDPVEVAARLAHRPIFVSSALYEPFGLAVLEAAAAGCPLILSDIPTFRELWDGTALFVAPGDSDGFAGAIETLVGNDLERDRLGRAARERARRFTPRRMAEGMAAIYARLTRGNGMSVPETLAGAA